MVWRYSPVILNHIHSAESHCAAFNTVARALSGFTEECKLSFLEMYAKIRSRMGALGVVERGDAETLALAGRFAELAEKNSIRLSACGKPDLRPAGIPVSSCIDGALIQRITGKAMSFKKDPGQRGVCACVESVDVGSYQTCLNGCAYCYANHSHAAATRKAACYDPESPFLCDTARPGDVITDRAIRMHGATGGQQLRLTL